MPEDKVTTPDATVAVVITNWNGRDLLETCLPTVLDQDFDEQYQVVVVDNASTDDSVEYVRDNFPDVHVIESDVNNYAAANNLGASSTSSEFVALLNTDTRVDRSWLSALVRRARSDDEIGAVGSLVLFTNGKINSAGIDLCSGYHWADRGFGREREVVETLTGEDAYGVSGCAVLYRRTCWEAVGGLDEDFHMYYEDVDMSLRCRQRGWRIVVSTESVVHHKYNASVFRADESSRASSAEGWQATPLKDRLGERNRLFVIARHHPDELAEEVAQSRFFLEADGEDLADGLRLALEKWELQGLNEELRGQYANTLLEARKAIDRLDRWRLRSAQLEEQVGSLEAELAAVHEGYQDRISAGQEELDGVRKGYMAQIESTQAQSAESHERYQATIRELQESQAEIHEQYGAQITRLERNMADATEAYEAQIAKGAAELAGAHKAYQAEIDHREKVITDLRELLGLRDSPN